MLKTICKGCIFNTSFPLLDKTGCRLNKSVFILDDNQFVDGYCRHKRTSKWVTKNKSSSEKELIDNILLEESVISAVILSFDNDVHKFQKTLDNLSNNKNLVKQLVVVTKPKDDTLQAKMELIDKSGLVWSVDSLTEEPPNDLEVVNYAFRLIKHNWFYVLRDGDAISDEEYQRIKDILSDLSNNTVAMFNYESDNVKLFVNKYAFAQMGGNNYEPWLQKIKNFENWKNVCKITE